MHAACLCFEFTYFNLSGNVKLHIYGALRENVFFSQRVLRGPPSEADSFSFNMRHIARGSQMSGMSQTYEYFWKGMGPSTDRVSRSAHLLQPVGHPGRRLRLPASRHGPHRADPVPHPRVWLRVDQPGRREERMSHATSLM